jgi:hypothetical protein
VEIHLESDIQNQLLLLQGKLTQLIKDIGLGMIDYNAFNQTKSQITMALLKIIDEL